MQGDEMIHIPEDIEPICRRAGWFPERRSVLPAEVVAGIPQGHPALEVLQQFHLCKVGYPQVVFGWLEEDFWDQDQWESVLSTKFVGIACQMSEGCLWIDSVGRCFFEPIAAGFCFVAENFGHAMQKFLIGGMMLPMLLPDEDSTTLYGEVYTRDSPELWRY